MVPENIHTPPTEEIPGRSGGWWGILNTPKFKAMYEAKLEFSGGVAGGGGGGGGVIGKISSVGGYGYFLEPNILEQHIFKEVFKQGIVRNKGLLTLVLIFLALSAYKSVLRVSSNDPLAGLA